MNETKRCDKCRWYRPLKACAHCGHELHKSAIISDFTSCPEWEEKPVGPFNNLKFYLKNATTGEMEVKYVCEDCGGEIKTPYRWWFAFPSPGSKKPINNLGWHYLCKECHFHREEKNK
jgi:rRNA maturation protein Nop10